VRPVEINLATRPFRNNTLYWGGFGSAAVGLAALTLVNLWLFLGYGSTMQQHRQDLTVKQGRRDALLREEQRLGTKLGKLDFKSLAGQAEFANDAIRRRTFSWTELFNRLEGVVPPSVMMLSIRPEIQTEGISVVVEGMAKDQEGLLDFEENLIHKPVFARIYPGGERREQRDRELRFSLKFDYLPPPHPDTAAGPASRDTGGPPDAEPSSKPSETPPAPVVAHPSPVPNPPAIQAPATSPASASRTPPPVPKAAVAAPVPPPISPSLATGSAPGAANGAASQPKATLPPPKEPPPERGGPRPMLRGGGRLGVRPREHSVRREASPEGPSARFDNVPLDAVLDYLMKQRKMTFVFGGDFDLRQKVSVDLTAMEEKEILDSLAILMRCVVSRESQGVYRLSPRAGGEPLEEQPVEEEPVPETGGGAGQESP